MVTGNASSRSFNGPIPDTPTSFLTAADETTESLMERARGWNCLNYNKPAEGSLTRHQMPSRDFISTCVDGLRTENAFPSCWDGVNEFDPQDPYKHLRYASFVLTGDCPPGFNIRLPTLLFEVIWRVADFTGIPGQFMLSMGDTTGE